MSGSAGPQVGELGMLEQTTGRFSPGMGLAIWTGHGWLPIRGVMSHHIQIERGFAQPTRTRLEMEVGPAVHYLPADAPRYDHTQVVSVRFQELHPAAGPAIRGTVRVESPGFAPGGFNRPTVVSPVTTDLLHPADDPPDPSNVPPVDSRAEAAALIDPRPAPPRGRKIRFLPEE